MARAIDVANFFIDIINECEDDSVTNLKLQKLLYFAQGQHLCQTGKPLFSENIEAWKLGPVVPAVYRVFKPCGNSPIPSLSEPYDYDSFSEEEKTILFDTLRKYGKYTGHALVDMTHEIGTPWCEIYGSDNSGQALIPNDLIMTYFQKESTASNIEKLIEKIPVVKKLSADEYDPSEDALWEDS